MGIEFEHGYDAISNGGCKVKATVMLDFLTGVLFLEKDPARLSVLQESLKRNSLRVVDRWDQAYQSGLNPLGADLSDIEAELKPFFYQYILSQKP